MDWSPVHGIQRARDSAGFDGGRGDRQWQVGRALVGWRRIGHGGTLEFASDDSTHAVLGAFTACACALGAARK